MHPIERRLAARWPPAWWGNVTVVLAVSGGADSVALLRAANAIRPSGPGRLVVAHFNHQLRGAEAQQDEDFTVDLCRRLDVPCVVGRAEVPPGDAPADAASGQSGAARRAAARSEAAARRLRYRFLAETAAEYGARLVATAHTADDQAETILHRIVRGTGLRGLSGMERLRVVGPAVLIRPLLRFRRAELRAYLGDLGQPFCRDSSNDDLRYTRNRLRLRLMPLLTEQFNPCVVDALLRLGRLAGEGQLLVERLAEQEFRRRAARTGDDQWRIVASGLADQPRYLLGELLRAAWRENGWPQRAMDRRHWNALAAMLAESDRPVPHSPLRRMFPGGILAEHGDGVLLLSRVDRRAAPSSSGST